MQYGSIEDLRFSYAMTEGLKGRMSAMDRASQTNGSDVQPNMWL